MSTSKTEPIKKFFNKIPGVSLPVSESYQILPTSNPANVSITVPPEERVRDKVGKRFKKLFNLESGDIALVDDANNGYQLSTWDRYVLFIITFGIAVASFMICFFLFPILFMKPRKFSVIWTTGSIFFLSSFCLLQGPKKYFKTMTESKNLGFSAIYIGSIVLTLVSTLILKMSILVIVGVIFQIASMIWYCFGYFPLSFAQLRFGGNVASTQIEGWMNS